MIIQVKAVERDLEVNSWEENIKLQLLSSKCKIKCLWVQLLATLHTCKLIKVIVTNGVFLCLALSWWLGIHVLLCRKWFPSSLAITRNQVNTHDKYPNSSKWLFNSFVEFYSSVCGNWWGILSYSWTITCLANNNLLLYCLILYTCTVARCFSLHLHTCTLAVYDRDGINVKQTYISRHKKLPEMHHKDLSSVVIVLSHGQNIP